MRKTIAAVTAGLLLVAGQAAANNAAEARVGDRVGARAGDSSEFQGETGLFNIPLIPLIVLTGVIITFVVVANDDPSESD